MDSLTRTTVLQRIPNLKLSIDSDNTVKVASPYGVLACGPHTLAVLDVFYQPCTVAMALAQLRASVVGAQDWINLTSTLTQLYQAGVLRDYATAQPTLATDMYSYDSAAIHVAMLNDRQRTAGFIRAIREVVRPGDVVVDIGTGTGVFAIAAAQAGARHVYAVEAAAIGQLAREAFAANQLSDRITLIQGWSTQVDLPERADVLVSEMVGTDPMGDYVLEVMRDAHRRFLKPDARIVPSNVRIYGLPVSIPADQVRRYSFTPDVVADWREWYAIDFEVFAAAQQASQYFSVRPAVAREWPTLGQPVLLADLDLTGVQQISLDCTAEVAARAGGLLNGVVIYFEVQLGPTTVLSLHPAQAGHDSFRFIAAWLLPAPLQVRPGERLTLRYRYRQAGASDQVAVDRLAEAAR